MRALILCLLLSIGLAAPAAAQQGWSLTREGDSFSFQISDRTPIPTVDELVARMREQMDDWPHVTAGPIRIGDTIYTDTFNVERTGRLTDDVTRTTEDGRTRVLMPRGTAVYMLTYAAFATGTNAGDNRWVMWCGRAPADVLDASGYCVRINRERPAYAAIPPTQSIMLPTSFEEFNSASMPRVDEADATARSEFPATETRYTLQEVNQEELVISATTQVDGQSRARPVVADRGSDGGGLFRDGGIAVRLVPASEAGAFTAQLVEPSDAPLREFAENLVQQVRAQRASGN